MQSKKIFDPIILILLTTLVIASYVIGFAVNENSAGGAINDSEHIWSNLQIFLNYWADFWLDNLQIPSFQENRQKRSK